MSAIADGGEVIFHLPNALQGYFIVNKQGQRIDDAPVNIVRDRTNLEDPVVHNGRSCIGCHVKGMNSFRDEIVATFAGRAQALFDLGRARMLYPGQPELDGLPVGGSGGPLAMGQGRCQRRNPLLERLVREAARPPCQALD